MNTFEWIKEHSTLVLLLVGGLLVGILFLKKTPTATAPTTAGADLSGLATDASGHPIVYRTASDTFITENISGSYNSATSAENAPASIGATTVGSSSTTTTTTTTDNHSAPIEHPIEPGPPPAQPPTNGLLGPYVKVNFGNRTYTSPSVKSPTPIPLPSTYRLIQGTQGRVWYVDSGNLQQLLTSGTGPPVTNAGYPVGSPENTPGAYGK